MVGPTRMSYHLAIAATRYLAVFVNRMVQALEGQRGGPGVESRFTWPVRTPSLRSHKSLPLFASAYWASAMSRAPCRGIDNKDSAPYNGIVPTMEISGPDTRIQ